MINKKIQAGRYVVDQLLQILQTTPYQDNTIEAKMKTSSKFLDYFDIVFFFF